VPHFEVSGSWMAELRDDRARVLLTCAHGGYAMPALVWVAAVRAHVLQRDRLQMRVASSGFPYFLLVDAFDEPIATSPQFGNETECRRAIHYVIDTAGSAPVIHVPEVAPELSWTGERASARIVQRRGRGANRPRFIQRLDASIASPRWSSPAGVDPADARFRLCGEQFVVLEATSHLLLRSRRLADEPECVGAIDALRDLARTYERYQRYSTPYGGFAFSIAGEAHEPLARSPVYASEPSREHAIELVQRVAPVALLSK
jgi:uncharacterized protein YegP (UPF0339 family)